MFQTMDKIGLISLWYPLDPFAAELLVVPQVPRVVDSWRQRPFDSHNALGNIVQNDPSGTRVRKRLV